jgi:8-oxo-dGTP pyrophosphatase MutT (NUDIX family)
MPSTQTKIHTVNQVSAGGVAYRTHDGQVEIALISVGEARRWQLPKGTVEKDETNEAAAVREVREETGIQTEVVSQIDRIEYWFYSVSGGKRTRHHKYVYFFLLRALSGDVRDHDHEVNESRWVEINAALEMLKFENERKILQRAIEGITQEPGAGS